MPQMKASVKATTSTLKLLRVLLSRDFVPEVRGCQKREVYV